MRPKRYISLQQAADIGIKRVKNPNWGSNTDYIKLETHNEEVHWLYLYSDLNDEINGRNPVRLSARLYPLDAKIYTPYDGNLSEAEPP